ncbi:hypothetical protein NM688_g8189 [Phlebia brevispora]|uniref:Uncharacterized protein n=1 Tax=Phlebia brevispora TaxID=194682 RepID=A0ACC1RW37_9APHY|nr:hypothetical protein NM688_g8189 [Phlebia brevispora]
MSGGFSSDSLSLPRFLSLAAPFRCASSCAFPSIFTIMSRPRAQTAYPEATFHDFLNPVLTTYSELSYAISYPGDIDYCDPWTDMLSFEPFSFDDDGIFGSPDWTQFADVTQAGSSIGTANGTFADFLEDVLPASASAGIPHTAGPSESRALICASTLPTSPSGTTLDGQSPLESVFSAINGTDLFSGILNTGPLSHVSQDFLEPFLYDASPVEAGGTARIEEILSPEEEVEDKGESSVKPEPFKPAEPQQEKAESSLTAAPSSTARPLENKSKTKSHPESITIPPASPEEIIAATSRTRSASPRNQPKNTGTPEVKATKKATRRAKGKERDTEPSPKLPKPERPEAKAALQNLFQEYENTPEAFLPPSPHEFLAMLSAPKPEKAQTQPPAKAKRSSKGKRKATVQDVDDVSLVHLVCSCTC